MKSRDHAGEKRDVGWRDYSCQPTLLLKLFYFQPSRHNISSYYICMKNLEKSVTFSLFKLFFSTQNTMQVPLHQKSI